MGEICARCGKELGFRDKRKGFHLTLFINSLNAGLFSEYEGRNVCISCQRELLDSNGIKYRGLYGLRQGMVRINELSAKDKPSQASKNPTKNNPFFSKPFTDGLEQGKRIVVIKDAVFSADGIGKHISHYSEVAEEFGYVYKSETHFPDAIGISLTMIFEKIIPTVNETNFVNCKHCTTRYDANQYFKCPQCGAPTN